MTPILVEQVLLSTCKVSYFTSWLRQNLPSGTRQKPFQVRDCKALVAAGICFSNEECCFGLLLSDTEPKLTRFNPQHLQLKILRWKKM